MKKVFITLVFTGAVLIAFAQKNVTTNPNSSLNQLTLQWQKEVNTKFAEVNLLTKAYYADRTKLTKDEQQSRLNEIHQKNQVALAIQKQHFGRNGDLSKKMEELSKSTKG